MGTEDETRIEESEDTPRPEGGIFELEEGGEDHPIETGHITELTGMYKDCSSIMHPMSSLSGPCRM
jgi:hypothetical protein